MSTHVHLHSSAPLITDPLPSDRDTPKPTLIRRVTSKLNISLPLKPGPDGLRSRPSTRTLPPDLRLPTPAPRSPASPTLPDSFVSKRRREAALRERGLLPPRKDLSVQEREEDERFGSYPSPASATFNGGSSEAERLKAGWLAVNRNSESSESDCGPHPSPYLQPTRVCPESLPSLPFESEARRSSERPSLCTSLPPLSIPSFLEVLHEESSDQAPITPPPPLSSPRLPIIVSSPSDEPVIVDSPVSCTPSSHYPGSTLGSSQSDHAPSVPERNHLRSPASRRRTSDSGHQSRRVVGTSLTRFGTHSLTNLRRSMTDSFGRASTSTLSSADHASIGPRTAISPTIHSIGSIINETTGIKDAESRRLSELAFLD